MSRPRRRGRDIHGVLLLDKPQMMGVESIQLDTVNLRMVARTLPGKQFEVGRRLRLLVAASLAKAGIATTADSGPMVGAVVRSGTAGGAQTQPQGPGSLSSRDRAP